MAGGKIITLNRKARHDYFVEETFETGIELVGTEVKSIRQGTVNLKDSFCTIDFIALIPLSLYFKGAHIKLELGLCKGKKLYDKRADIARRDAKRDMDRAMKQRIQ